MIHERGLVNGTAGNVSARAGGRTVITPTRRHYDELARSVAEHLRVSRACLLARHGVVAAAATPRDAVELCTTIEHQAQVQHLLAARLPVE